MKEQPRLINWQKPDGYIWEIYAIVNCVNHKTYIGQTKRGVNKRFLEHLKGNDQCSALNKAVNKYGADSFTVLKIDVARTQEEADEKERYWVSRYESTADKRGYNLTSGGGQFEFSSATKMHMSESRQGSKNSFFGKHHSEESKRKMSEKKKGMSQPHLQKPVLCVETGVVFDSMSEAAKDYKCNRAHIGQICAGVKGRRTAGGVHWRYA